MRKSVKEDEIAAVFLEMLHDMPLESLRVQDLIRKAGVSKSSFYRMFLDKYEVATWIYKKQADEIVQKAPKLSDWKEWSRALHVYIREHKAFFRNIASYHGQNSFADFLTEYFCGNIIRFRSNGGEALTEDQRFAVRAFSILGAQMTVEWILNGFEPEDDVLVHRMELCIPACIRSLYQ